MMFTGQQYAEQAKKTKYDSLKYSQYDCQAFAELVLRDLGVRSSSGAVFNWKGSNDIYRNAVSWVGTVEECRKKYGCIPLGSWAFMWDTTGNERQRGYYDGLGNASHIGIVIADNLVKDSTKIKNASGKIIRDGVGTRSLKDFQKIGLCKYLDYFGTSNILKIEIARDDILNVYNSLQSLVKVMGDWLK